MLYAGLEGHSLPGLFHERMGSSTVEILRNYVVLRQREGAFRKGNPDALLMLLASPAMQYASSKYIFGLKGLPVTDKEAAEEFAKLLIAALCPPVPSSKTNSKKTGKRKA